MRQSHFEFFKNVKTSFGGSLLVGKRKSARPLSTKNPIHMVLKSTGGSYFNPGNRELKKIFHHHAQKYHLKLYEMTLNWSHVHLVFQISTRANYLAFIRTLTAALILFFSKQKGKNLQGLFNLRPFTRIVNWGRDFKNIFNYHDLNDQEAWGLISRKKNPHPSTASS